MSDSTAVQILWALGIVILLIAAAWVAGAPSDMGDMRNISERESNKSL